jgi:hypothetical protein
MNRFLLIVLALSLIAVSSSCTTTGTDIFLSTPNSQISHTKYSREELDEIYRFGLSQEEMAAAFDGHEESQIANINLW